MTPRPRRRGRCQVANYRSELTDLRRTLNSEVEALRAEFGDLRANLPSQLEATAAAVNAEERGGVGRGWDTGDRGSR